MNLIVAAHADDEVLGCGGLMARWNMAGEPYKVLLFGPGRYDAEEIGERLKPLGNYVLLTYFEDQEFDRYPIKQLAGHIETMIDLHGPELVLTHSMHDVNQDHRQVAMATLVATRPKEGCPVKRVMAYEVLGSTEWAQGYRPTVWVPLGPEHIGRKEAMMEDLYPEEAKPPRTAYNIATLADCRGSQIGAAYAEAYELLRDIWA